MNKVILLDGNSLTIEQLNSIQNNFVKICVTEDGWRRVREGRQLVEEIISGGQKVYGINTGFGNFANISISAEQLQELQRNLIRSHAAGVGEPLPPQRSRLLLALRINVFAKGRSGIREETLRRLIDACNKWCVSYIPEKGTVGASGDLAPLAHLALGMMGEGKMWNPEKNIWGNASEILRANNLEPIDLTAKEGLALINGTQLIVSLGAEATYRSKKISVISDIVAALSLEALKGTVVAFSECIHSERPHNGQILSAARLRALLHSEKYFSEISESHKNCGQVQDSYALRCIPQVHGIGTDTIKFVEGILTTEMNSATDNPMVFAENKKILSGGNFHGEYPAKVMDYLAIAVHEFANISERRIERLVNPSLSNLPAFLVKEGGLNSGFMIAHCTAAALVSENKTLCHPSSVDSISTSAAKEDHVSMGGWAARKVLQVVLNVETVLAIELLAACQGIDLLRPLKTTEPLEAVHKLVRSKVAAYERDRFMSPDIEAALQLIQSGEVINAVRPFIENTLL